METRHNPEVSLEEQLESLRSVDATESAQRVLRGIKQRKRWQRRQVIAALCGTCVSAIGTIHFVLQGDPFAYFALMICSGVLAYTAWRSARNAVCLSTPKSGKSMLSIWRAELRRQLQHTHAALLVAGLFVALTAWVVSLHGIGSWRSAPFLAMAAAVSIFAAYQYLVIRPSLQRELEILDQDG